MRRGYALPLQYGLPRSDPPGSGRGLVCTFGGPSAHSVGRALATCGRLARARATQEADKSRLFTYIGLVKTPFASLAALSLLAAPAAASQPASDSRARFGSLFVDWNAASRESIEAEREQATRAPQQPAPVATASAAVAVPGSRALGERVGDIVALGDCAEGERVARAAGDFALVAAVRDYCNARPAEQR